MFFFFLTDKVGKMVDACIFPFPQLYIAFFFFLLLSALRVNVVFVLSIWGNTKKPSLGYQLPLFASFLLVRN